jgi:hypothetical protein
MTCAITCSSISRLTRRWFQEMKIPFGEPECSTVLSLFSFQRNYFLLSVLSHPRAGPRIGCPEAPPSRWTWCLFFSIGKSARLDAAPKRQKWAKIGTAVAMGSQTHFERRHTPPYYAGQQH